MKLNKGFTLIELLIVIAILAALAVIVVFAINPVQNLARTRDTGRLSTVAQLGHALESYGTANDGVFVPHAGCLTAGQGTFWANCLINSGDINVVPALVTNAITTINGLTYFACGDIAAGPRVQNGWCYTASAAAGTQPAVIYTRLESLNNHSKCAAPTADAAWAVYSTADGKAGVVCTTGATSNVNEPTPGNQTFR